MAYINGNEILDTIYLPNNLFTRKGTLTAENDLNDVIVTGIYFVLSGDINWTDMHYPAQDKGVLEVIGDSHGPRVMQRYTKMSENTANITKVFVRHRYGQNWSEWKQL